MRIERAGSCRRSWIGVARVAFACVAGWGCAAMAAARGAQEPPAPERFFVAQVSGPAVADRDLALLMDLQTSDDPRRAGEFATLGDATLSLRFHHLGKEMIDLLTDGPKGGASSLTALLDVELLHDDGAPVARPGFVIGSSDDSDVASLLGRATVQRLAPEEWAQASVPFTELVGVGQLDLAPGIYRIRVTYRGTPEELRAQTGEWTPMMKHWRTAWHGAAKSQQLRFRITGAAGPLAWSDAQDGLRVAAVVTPPERRLFVGETAVPRFLVENVSTAPIRFWRPAAASQEDEIDVRRADGETTQRGKAYFTGWHTSFEWTLPPGGRVWIDAAPLHLARDGWSAGNTSGIASAALGRCTIAYMLCLTDGRRLDLDTPNEMRMLRVPPFELDVLDRAGR